MTQNVGIVIVEYEIKEIDEESMAREDGPWIHINFLWKRCGSI